MNAGRVGLTTLVALGTVAVLGSPTAGVVGMHAHGFGGLVWDFGCAMLCIVGLRSVVGCGVVRWV